MFCGVRLGMMRLHLDYGDGTTNQKSVSETLNTEIYM